MQGERSQASQKVVLPEVVGGRTYTVVLGIIGYTRPSRRIPCGVKTRAAVEEIMELASDILRKAQQLIVKYGWVRGTIGDEKRGYCMYGALETTVNNKYSPLACSAYMYVVELIREKGSDCIVTFNDYVAQNEVEVIEVFNRAIQHAKLQERKNAC